MKEKIKSLLQGAWSSTISGVDIDKATESIEDYVLQQNRELVDVITDSCERQLLEKERLIESFELDMENSNRLLIEAKEELELFKQIHSNNPNKYQSLGLLLFRIEEQIIENGK